MNYTDYPATRASAKTQGFKRYFTGKPCSKGHLELRFLTGTCVECQRMAIREWAVRNPGEAKKRARAMYLRDPEKVKARSRRFRRKEAGIPEATRPCPQHCELCSRILEKGKIHLDHDHTTGAFRGWLCNRCNLSLGHLGDTIAGVQRALAYLVANGSS